MQPQIIQPYNTFYPLKVNTYSTWIVDSILTHQALIMSKAIWPWIDVAEIINANTFIGSSYVALDWQVLIFSFYDRPDFAAWSIKSMYF